MKAVVLTLALLFLTGSQAQHETQQEEPPSQWEQVKDLAEMYLNSTIAKFEETELGKKLKLKVLTKLETLRLKVAALPEQLGQTGQTQNFLAVLRNGVGMLTPELNNLTEVMKPYLEGIQKKWQERVEPLHQDLGELARKQLQKLQEKLGLLGAKVLNRTRVHVERARPYVDTLHPFLEIIGEELRQCLEPCKGKLREYLEPYSEQLLSLRKQAEHMYDDGNNNNVLTMLGDFLQGIDIDIHDISRRLTGQ